MFNQSSSMKQLLGFGAVAAFLLLGTSTLTAQQKIAHINVDTIILRMTKMLLMTRITLSRPAAPVNSLVVVSIRSASNPFLFPHCKSA